MSRRILGISEVCHLTGRSRSTVRRYIADPNLNFPPPIRLGPRDRGWFSDEVQEWIDSLRRESDQNANPTSRKDPATGTQI